MPNTPANDAPYVIGAIEDSGTADYPGLPTGNASGGFDVDGINPIVVNADGSFTAAFAVSAPSYLWNINPVVASNGFAFGGVVAGVFSEIFLPSLIQGSGGPIAYVLAGRNAANAPVSIVVTPVDGRIVLTEAILANFAPGTSPSLVISGLAPGSNAPMFITGEVTDFYDGAAPTVTKQANTNAPTVPANGTVLFSTLGGLVESFTLQNATVWTTGSTQFRLTFTTLEPLDLTGVSQTINQANVFNGSGYSTTITITPVGGVVAVPETLLEQLESRPGNVRLQVNGAVQGTVAQADVTVQVPVTHITEGLYTQNFDANGNPTGEAVRVDVAANAVLQDEDDTHYVMSRSADGGLVIAWLGNDDSDGEADAVYVRKLDDAGNPVGDTLALSGLTAEAFDTIINDGGEAGFAALADGRFALAYTVEADEVSLFYSGTASPSGVTFGGVTGQLERVELGQFTAAGALTVQVRGEAANGTPLAVAVSFVNGVFEMTDALRAQFAPDSHLSLFVGGLTVNTPYGATVTTRDIFNFDETSVATTITRAVTAANNPGTIPDVFIGTGQGVTTSYQVNAATAAAGATPVYALSLFSAQPLDLTGQTQYVGSTITGILTTTANTFVDGKYLNTIVINPVGGLVEVPASIRAQVDDDGLRSLLSISGLQAGTPVNVGINIIQPSSYVVPGVYTQTFDADGVSEGPAQRIDDVDATLAQAAPFAEDGSLGITTHADGGFHVSWLAQNTDGSTLDRLITREFNADGELTGTSINVNGSAIPGVAAVEAAGGDSSVSGDLQVVELGNGGFATVIQVDANLVFAAFNSFTFVPSTGNGQVTVTPLQGQLESVMFDTGTAIGSALASQTRTGFVSGKGLDGNPLQIAVTVVGGRFDLSEDVRALFAADEKISLTVSGVTNPAAAPNTASFAFVPAFVTSRDIFTFDETSPTQTINRVVTATTNPTTPANADASFGATIGNTVAFQINSLTAASGETPDFVLFVSSENPINTAGLSIYSGPNAPPLYSTTPNNTNSPLGLFATSLSVTPVAGRIDIPQALLDQFPHGGFTVTLQVRGLQGGSTINVDTIVQQPSQILAPGLFVQLFDSAGLPTGDFVRVDGPSTAVFADEDGSSASIQSDGAGGFRVVWKSDFTGDEDSDAIVIRHFDQNGAPIGDPVVLTSIPDRVYDEGQAVTLYTSGLFADPDPGDVLTFSATGLPEGLTIDPATGVISGTADEVGLHAVVVTATDAGGLSASTNFEIFVVDDGVVEENAGPTAVSLANVVEATPENGGQIKVADIVLTDDGQGTNDLALSGADAALFSIIDGALYFNGGGDFEGLAAFDVTVSASDATTTDAAVSADFELLLTDVAENESFTGTNLPEEFVINPLSLDNWTLDMLGGDDYVLTGAGADVINAGQGNDVVLASAGHDLVLAGGGNDRILGGEGDDDISGEAGNDDLFGDAGNDTLRGGDGLDGIFGGDNNDSIFGNAGNDTLNGENGDDTILGGFGDDIVNGGNGVDTISGEAGADQISGGANNDTIDGGNDNDTIHGDGGEDQILGGAGVDQLFGDEGNDGISGGDGNDTVDGGSGDDTIGGDAGNDILAGGTGFDTISGGLGTDDISGGGDDDVLLGGSGNDTLRGDDDNDTLNGDFGADFLYGGNGDDTVNGEADNDYLEGNDGADILSGGSGNDTIDGGSGTDVISGGVGRDVMTGGLDADTFTFGLASHSRLANLADHITDFDTLLDLIDLSAIDANSKTVGDQAFTWIGAGAFTKAAGQLRYAVVGTATHITGDTNGDGKADFEIVLDNALTQPLTDTDFIL